MRRLLRILLVAAGVVAFLAISLALTRILSANGVERTRVDHLIEAQARGDAKAMTDLIAGCRADAACRTGVAANAARLRSPGKVQIVRFDPSTNFSLGGTSGVARVVWKTTDRLTVVQCIEVRRTGGLFGGLGVELRSLSRPIARTASCPSAS